MCDFCLAWVHAKCEEMSNGLLNEVESYRCTYCTQWEGKYASYFEPLLRKGHHEKLMLPKAKYNPDYGSIEQWQTSMFPTRANHKITLDHVLLMVSIW